MGTRSPTSGVVAGALWIASITVFVCETAPLVVVGCAAFPGNGEAGSGEMFGRWLIGLSLNPATLTVPHTIGLASAERSAGSEADGRRRRRGRDLRGLPDDRACPGALVEEGRGRGAEMIAGKMLRQNEAAPRHNEK